MSFTGRSIHTGKQNWFRLRILLLAFTLSSALYSQTVGTAAGNSTWGRVYNPTLDSAGNLYAPDLDVHVVYKTDKFGTTTIVAGTAGKAGYGGDGGLATSALLNAPAGVAVAADGTLYICDYSNQRIRKVAANGIITTVAGTGVAGFTGDGGQALQARLYNPFGIALDSAGSIIFVDFFNHRMRKITADGVIKTIAGGGQGGDGDPATSALLGPGYFVLTADGSIYFTDDYAAGYSNKPLLRKISPTGVLSTVAGNGTRNFTGDGGPALSAGLVSVDGVALDSNGNLFISGGNRVRKIAPNGIITTYAGTGAAGAAGNNGPAISATFNNNSGMTIDANNTIYMADTNNRQIRKLIPIAPPTISFTNAVVPVWGGASKFASNMYVTIYGSNLSTISQAWDASFVGGKAPTSMGGVSVTVNGLPAFIQYVSPGQVNINTPDDVATGPVNIVLTNAVGVSNTGTATRTTLSPTLLSVPTFSAGSKLYVVAQTPDFASYVGPAGLVQGVPFKSAKPGDTIIIFATGCGPTTPTTQAGVVAAGNSPLATSFQLKIGGITANVPFAGMLAGTVGLYQLNVVVPNVPPGDLPIELILGSTPNAQNLVISIGQ
jgi:uncharacterized protein (TIGR03437 family)